MWSIDDQPVVEGPANRDEFPYDVYCRYTQTIVGWSKVPIQGDGTVVGNAVYGVNHNPAEEDFCKSNTRAFETHRDFCPHVHSWHDVYTEPAF